MKRLSFFLALSLVGAVGLAEAQEEPPGYADVIIVDGIDGVAITITSVEDPNDGRIRCGRGADDRCEQGSSITWSIRNDSSYTVDVTMTDWTNETTGASENPFPNDPSRTNIGSGQRRPLPRQLRQNVVNGTYKYTIVVVDRGEGTEIGRLDPRLDIRRR